MYFHIFVSYDEKFLALGGYQRTVINFNYAGLAKKVFTYTIVKFEQLKFFLNFLVSCVEEI